MTPSKDEDTEFKKLKEKWLQEKYKGNRGPGETQLMQSIVRWTNETLKEMIKEETDEIGKNGCKIMQEQGKKMSPEELEVCAFIVNNLWNMKTKSASLCRKDDIKAVMEEYVRCSVMNAWIHKYWNTHCEVAKNVIHNALGVMGNISASLSSSDGCEECDYKKLELMKIKEIPMLAIILHMIQNNTKVMKLINSGKSEKPCKEQGVNGLVGDLLNNNGTMSTGTVESTGKEKTREGRSENDDNAAASAGSGPKNETSQSAGSDEVDLIYTYGPGGLTVTRVPSRGRSTNEAVLLVFGTDGPFPGIEDEPKKQDQETVALDPPEEPSYDYCANSGKPWNIRWSSSVSYWVEKKNKYNLEEGNKLPEEKEERLDSGKT
ncbi:SICA antigen [Plasmodium coatneyi]|uniref:SICA antigen n=1 Tax=Plasmodium coatneyi TaxID=208452 RepID=A0A1B1E6D6_9APIC|nr:SICA antigen [Plasmodium coatneyi]ANQ10571.1 SICA antigen [Plasmodium coatneyi]